MSAFPVDVSRQSLRGDAITGHAAMTYSMRQDAH